MVYSRFRFLFLLESPFPDTLLCRLSVPHMAKHYPFPGVNSQCLLFKVLFSLLFRELTILTSFLCQISPHYGNFPVSNPYYTVPCFLFFSPTVINSVNIKYLPALVYLTCFTPAVWALQEGYSIRISELYPYLCLVCNRYSLDICWTNEILSVWHA